MAHEHGPDMIALNYLSLRKKIPSNDAIMTVIVITIQDERGRAILTAIN